MDASVKLRWPVRSAARRSRRVLFALALAAAAVSLVAVVIHWQTSDRRLVRHWKNHFDPNLSYSANQLVRRAGLRSVAPKIVPILRQDLNYEARTRQKLNDILWRVASKLNLQSRTIGEAPPWVRAGAAQMLAELGPAASPALPDLIQRTRDSEALVRATCALALGNIGDRSSQVIEALTPLLKENNRHVSVSAAYALWRLQPEDGAAIERFASVIGPRSGPDNLSRVSSWLQDCGESARPLAPALRQAMTEDPSTDGRVAAALALWRINGESQAAVELSDLFVSEIKAGGFGANPMIGLIKAENGVAGVALRLSEIPAVRTKIRPDLVQWSVDAANPRRSRWAKQMLVWLERAEAESAGGRRAQPSVVK